MSRAFTAEAKTRQALFHRSEVLDDLADTLPGNVLERTGLEDIQNTGLNPVPVGLEIVIVIAENFLRSLHDGIGSRGGGVDHIAELVVGARQSGAVDIVGAQRPRSPI